MKNGEIEHFAHLGHLCLPPKVFPENGHGYSGGPGMRLTCGCERVWQAEGLRVEVYPVGGESPVLGPERWVYLYGGKPPTNEEAGLYDWRNPTVILLDWLQKRAGVWL